MPNHITDLVPVLWWPSCEFTVSLVYFYTRKFGGGLTDGGLISAVSNSKAPKLKTKLEVNDED